MSSLRTILYAIPFALALLVAPIAAHAAGEKEGGGASQKPLDCSTCVGAECVKLRCLEKGGNLTISPCNRFDPACSGEGGYTDVNEPWGRPGAGGSGDSGVGERPREDEDEPANPFDDADYGVEACERSTGGNCMSFGEAAQFASAVCKARGGRMTAHWKEDGGRDLACSTGGMICFSYGEDDRAFQCDESTADAPIDPFVGGRPESLGGVEPMASSVDCGPGEEERVVRVRDRRGGELRERKVVRCVEATRRTDHGVSSEDRKPRRDETRRTRDYRKGAADEDGNPEVRTRRTRDYRKQPEVEPDWPTVE